MGMENDFPTLRLLRALRMGGSRGNKEEWGLEQSEEHEPCQIGLLLSARCCRMGMQAPCGLTSEMLREAENPDSYVKFLNF